MGRSFARAQNFKKTVDKLNLMCYIIFRKRKGDKKMKLEKEAILNMKKSMTKKEFMEFNKSQRVNVMWNTGTRTHKSKKDYNRQKNKKVVFDY